MACINEPYKDTIMIAVTGATGQLGRIVIAKLKAKVPASDIVALARDTAKAADLGVAVRQADYAKPETLTAALAGVDTLLLISGSEVGKRATQHKNIIEAAKAAGVTKVVYTSLLRADTSPLSLAPEHVASETDLKASGLDYTILRNGWYTENYATSITGAPAHGVIIGAAGAGRISSATREDYAAAAVAVLTSAGHSGKTYELAGDVGYTLADLAAEVGRQTGKPVAYNNLPEADYAKALTGFGLPEFLAGAIASWDAATEKGALEGKDKTLSQLIGRPTTPLATAVEAILKA